MPADKPMNILFLFSDQHRRDSAGCYCHPLVQTPNLDRLAAGGARFTRAYAAAPICGPCRSALITGRHLHRCGACTHGHMKRDMGLPTMATVFRQAGYATGAFGKVHVAGESDANDIGFDERALEIYTPMQSDYQHAIGLEKFWQYCSYLPQYRPAGNPPARNSYNPANAPIDMPEELILDHMVADRSINFLERHGDHHPFFLWVGFEKPHTELYAPKRFHDLYDPDQIKLPDNIWNPRHDLPATIYDNPQFPIVTREAYTDRELRCCMAAYYANVSYMDEQLGRVLDALERIGLADNTLVVYSSDHGENLFSHGLVHKLCFFEEAVGVPLIVRLPGLTRPGEVRDQFASHLDLFPTFAAACGVEPPAGLDGASLLPVLQHDAPLRDAVVSDYYDYGIPERMLRTERWKYVHSHGDRHQLYDLEHDPDENRNLAGDPAYATIAAELNARLCRDWAMPDLTGVPIVRGDARPGQRSHPANQGARA